MKRRKRCRVVGYGVAVFRRVVVNTRDNRVRTFCLQVVALPETVCPGLQRHRRGERPSSPGHGRVMGMAVSVGGHCRAVQWPRRCVGHGRDRATSIGRPYSEQFSSIHFGNGPLSLKIIFYH